MYLVALFLMDKQRYMVTSKEEKREQYQNIYAGLQKES